MPSSPGVQWRMPGACGTVALVCVCALAIDGIWQRLDVGSVMVTMPSTIAARTTRPQRAAGSEADAGAPPMQPTPSPEAPTTASHAVREMYIKGVEGHTAFGKSFDRCLSGYSSPKQVRPVMEALASVLDDFNILSMADVRKMTAAPCTHVDVARRA
jgi:hypothetical protein